MNTKRAGMTALIIWRENNVVGYIKIDRKILKWEWWSDINTYRLFTYMLMVAYWRPGNYKGREILRGSFPSSIKDLSRETNLTENEIRTAIRHLKSTGEITSKSYNKFTVFTVKNYDLYQSDNEQNYKESTGEITSKSQAINEQITNLPIIKESKKEIKEEDKENITVSLDTVCKTEVRQIMEEWNKLSKYGIKQISRLNKSSNRYNMLVARIKQYGKDDILTAIDKIKQSDYCQGKNKYGWTITFDWFVRPNNFPKVLDGNYDNRGGTFDGQPNRATKKYNDRLLPGGTQNGNEPLFQ